MSLSLLFGLCGVPLVIVITGLSIMLCVVALYLTFGAKNERLLSAFMPMSLLPAMAGLAATFTSTLLTIASELNAESDVAIDSGLVFQMNMIPLFAGLVMAVPPALIAMVGRWRLAWGESGIELFPKKPKPIVEIDPATQLGRDAEDYLERLVRQR